MTSMLKITQDFFENIPDDKYGINLMAFEEMMILGEVNEYFLLDVRDEEQFKKVRIPNSTNIPSHQLHMRFDEIPSENKIIIISNKGLIAAQISSLLNACGYKTWTLREGIEGYMDIGGDIEIFY